jgi:hypothetical protein
MSDNGPIFCSVVDTFIQKQPIIRFSSNYERYINNILVCAYLLCIDWPGI